MNLIKTPLLCSLLALGACSSSENEALNPNQGPTSGDPLAGSITISTTPSPQLEALPDVVYDPTLATSNNDSLDGVALSEADASASGMVDGGSGTDGGSGDTGGGISLGSGTDAGIAGTADAGSSDAGDFASDGGDMPSLPPGDDINPVQPRAGTLTAADYDDQLNPHLYQRYASDYLQTVGGKLDVPYLDLSNRIALYVTDNQGRQYANVSINVANDNGDVLNLLTPASGATYLYSDIDALPEQFTITATGPFGTAINETVNLADVNSGRIDIMMPEDSAPPEANQGAQALDVMFVIDTTGSMGDELSYIQSELESIIYAIPTDLMQVNVGLTFYRDIGDQYVVRSHGLNNDISSVQNTLNSETFGGGGDYPEAMDQALNQAVDASWTQDSKRVLFLIADAPPHGDKMRATWNAATQARAKNIHVVPVAASGVGDDAEYLMRSMAAFTNSRYLFLTDDSGVGNPHATPDVDCYVVTQLNNLMIRVLNSLISGVRQEPSDNEVIRTVGNYNKGVCDQVQTN